MKSRNQASAQVTTCIVDSLKSALEACTEFGGNYGMYSSYCNQLATATKNGVKYVVCLAPVPRYTLSLYTLGVYLMKNISTKNLALAREFLIRFIGDDMSVIKRTNFGLCKNMAEVCEPAYRIMEVASESYINEEGKEPANVAYPVLGGYDVYACGSTNLYEGQQLRARKHFAEHVLNVINNEFWGRA